MYLCGRFNKLFGWFNNPLQINKYFKNSKGEGNQHSHRKTKRVMNQLWSHLDENYKLI